MAPFRLAIIAALILASTLTGAQTRPFTGGNHTAYILKQGKWECGVFQPLRIGISKRLELTSSAFLFPLLPNAGVKLSWKAPENISFASEHQLSIPSIFLNTISRKGIGGLLSPEFDFPFMISTQHSFLITRMLNDSSLLNFRIGFAWTYRSGQVDPLATIDLPLFYPAMAHYYKGVTLQAGTSYMYPLLKNWMLEESIRMMIVTRQENNFFAENTGYISWRIAPSFRIKGGYNLSYGQLPFGNHWQLWPSLDIVFGSKK